MENHYFAPSLDVLHDFLYFQLEPVYEQSHWRADTIPWGAVAHERIDDQTVEWVRSSAIFECGAHAGALHLYREFTDDPDFTQWVGRWLFEQGRHPLLLTRWLHEVGVPFREAYFHANHARYPQARPIHTLAVNLIAEMKAAAWYHTLAKLCDEPVLRGLLGHLSGDEARHAATLLLYARRYLAHANDPRRERRELLKCLHSWLLSSRQRLPFAEYLPRGATDNAARVAEMARVFDGEAVERRICAQFGALAGVEINGKDEIKRAIRAFI